MKRKASPESKPKTGRDARGRILPGTTGNPGGRPKDLPEFRKRAREATSELVIDKWIAEVKRKGRNWVKCSELLAAYGYGKPTQDVKIEDVTVRDATPPLSRDERRAELKMHLEREAKARLPDNPGAPLCRGERCTSSALPDSPFCWSHGGDTVKTTPDVPHRT